MYVCFYVSMSFMAGQTAGPIALKIYRTLSTRGQGSMLN